MEILLDQERQARLANDENKMTEIMSQIMSQCKDDNEVISCFKILVRRKAQIKQSLKTTINTVLSYKMANFTEENVNFMLRLLREVLEGRFYLEEERIRVTKTLKELYESKNDDIQALDIVFSVPVETFDIPDSDKIEFQLEVLRLCVKTKDWNKSECVSRRIRLSYFEETSNKTYEINFYTSMIGVSLGQRKFFEAAKYFKNLYAIDLTESTNKILYCTFFAIISDSSDEKTKMITECLECKDNTDKMRKVIKWFSSREVIPTKLCDLIKTMDIQMSHFLDDFLKAINIHNIKVVSEFYTKIRIEDLKIIMQCTEEECVNLICDGVLKKIFQARIDQAQNMILFKEKVQDVASDQIDKVLNRLIRVNHMIQKERYGRNN